MAIKGLKDLVYALVTEESEQTTVYGEVKKLGPAMALNLQPSINRGNLRADDKVLFSDAAKGPIAVTLNTAYLEEEVEADILGKTLDGNGGLTDSVDDNPPYIAIGGRAESARGGYEYFWIYRIKLSPAEENKETKQDTPTYQTPNLSGEALPRLHDGKEKYKLWDRSPKVTDQSIFAEWFEQVIDSDYVPEV
ncbi:MULTISPECIES: major tail protein [unclassified Oceanobacillus]|uniref:major tail protein n=1 Tax=unclassified Oceanobacillus TaxID=2630292 RepID=UPI001BED26E2|nr:MULTISPECIES: major tail protein [unclassified Oceanobacillus]MBT2600944.1 phage tail protein [Oceanobacillus sp. ISL-74]MBT2653605.1 phage tail protein [Oceanobacillus sp. ISL-73]